VNSITLNITCSCGNTSTRTEGAVKGETKFYIDTAYNTGLLNPITNIVVRCVNCGAALTI
jgi:hypothetical protein